MANDAEAFFDRLPTADQEKAMAILLRLIAVTPDGSFVRRGATLDELMFVGSSDDVRGVLESLVAARLVVSSGGSERVMVDLAHEAIITAWPRFRR